MKKFLYSFLVIVIIIIGLRIFTKPSTVPYVSSNIPDVQKKPHLFAVQSIDTMKYSRDQARTMKDTDAYNQVIDKQMQSIEDAGATHVAIDTPYDEEFIPVLTRWVNSARSHHLSVWFRGNFAGWEGWFDYKKITATQHEAKLTDFISKHSNLFENGDIFTPCTECENGGPGDPRKTGKKQQYEDFLVAEYNLATQGFKNINKNVSVYATMNGDIAKLIMDATSTQKLGSIIMIDHYTPSTAIFSSDISSIAISLNATIGIGEFGAPLPDINGSMTEQQQADFVKGLFDVLYGKAPAVSIVNYWDLKDGSTALLNADDSERAAYSVVKNYYTAPYISGIVSDTSNKPLAGAHISVVGTNYGVDTDANGYYQIFLPQPYRAITIAKDGYLTLSTTTLQEDLSKDPVIDFGLMLKDN